MKKNYFIKALLKTVIIGALSILFILPLVWMICSSLKTTSEVFARPYYWLPKVARWDNYAVVWTDEKVSMLRSYYNSIKIVVFSTIGQIAIASMAAYAFAKIKFAGKNLVFLLFLSSMMIPSQVTIIPRFMLFKSMGLYNNHWAIILPSWFGATAIFMLRQFYMGLPDDLMEAAKIDGAGHVRIFTQVMLPLTKSAMVSLVVLAFIAAWNEYMSPLIFITDTHKYTIAQAIRWYLLDELQRYELTMASATSAIVPAVILFIFCQKYFVEGIATAGVKG
ncbi:MAG: carbohydrate ABC transporter permease [Clostridiaceae bacterium]|nr:carbohydrate ABC transporter permease [Clostridiaceae bacterium]